MLLKELVSRQLVKKQIPSFIPENTHYLALMGSVAYGCSEDYSDMDIYGWCIPPKDYIFPHLAGYIPGFGKKPPNFETWQEHHIQDEQKKRNYDVTIYSVIRYFELVMENNPNMIDSLFVSPNCILHCSEAANIVRENRHVFLHKGAWHKFKGYAFSSLNKCKTRSTEPFLEKILRFEAELGIPHESNLEEGLAILSDNKLPPAALNDYKLLYAELKQEKARAERTKIYGYDTKFAYHAARLASEAEEILTDHTLTLDRYDRREMLKDIRKGNWTLQQVRDWFVSKEKELDVLYQKSTLRHSPDEAAIKRLLLNVLESHYGSLEKAVVVSDDVSLRLALGEIAALVDKHRRLLG